MKFKAFLMAAVASLFIFCISATAGDGGTVILSLDVTQHRFTKYQNAQITLELDNKEYREQFVITRDSKNIELKFDVDAYEPGTPMKFTGDYGMLGLVYYDEYANTGKAVKANTYTYETEEGPVHNNKICMSIDPMFYKDVDLFIDYKPQTFTEYTFLYEDDYAYVPVIELATALGVPEAKYFPEYNCVRLAAGETEIIYFLDSNKYTVNGEEFTSNCNTTFVGSTIFAALRPFADTFKSEIIFTDEGYKYNINLSQSEVVKEYNNYVFGKTYVINERNISSDTNYLIWVSKSEFTVRIYTGEKGNWDFVAGFPCAIGAPGTPTCEGVFKYYQHQKMWPYANYYCGPIMRFNGGYALHSTLIRYNGVPYDNRVGVKISHGCVRLRPENINWMAATIPLYTTVYVTP